MMSMRDVIAAMLKAAFGTDERCKMEGKRVYDAQRKPTGSHVTHVLAERAERSIGEFDEAATRLSRLSPAANLTDALGQLTAQERRRDP